MTGTVLSEERSRFEAFLNWLRERGRKEATLESYSSAHRTMFCGAERAAESLTKMSGFDLRQWRLRALHRGAKPTSINHRLGFIRLYARWGLLQHQLTAERTALLQAVPDVPLTRLGSKTLGDVEFRRLMAVVETQASIRDRALFFLLLSGLRVGEVCGLEREDLVVNAHRGHVEVHGSQVKFSAARQVPLGRQARFHVTRHLETLPANGPVFVGERGLLTTDGAYKVVRRLGEAAGLHLHPHLLRHQAARLWLAATNNDLVGLQAVLGHANIQTTAKHYCRKSLTDLQDACDRIAQ